jgi:membrane protease subunit HflC
MKGITMKMKDIAIAIFIALVVIVMGLHLTSFQVTGTESALVTRFGKPVRTITEPKLCFKFPAPIEQVHRFDAGMQVFEADTGETTTKGAVPIIVKTSVVWRIDEPLKFFKTMEAINRAELYLNTHISDTQNRVIGRHFFGEFVNSDPAKIKINEIEAEMLTHLQQTLSNRYGIEIKTVGIKQVTVNEVIRKKLLERLK